jgi:transcriptional antiterminator NusG
MMQEIVPMAAKWYIVHAHSGFENKVRQSILEKAAQQGLTEKIEEVRVPTEQVQEVRRGKKVQSERKYFPGYVLVKMEMNDQTWHLVKSIPKVTDFLGSNKGSRPVPIREEEANALFRQMEEGMEKPKRTVHFESGESVKVTDGPFESFTGVVEEVDENREKIKVSVSIFGRPTPVELDYSQVEKVS